MFGTLPPNTQTHSVTLAHLTVEDRFVICHLSRAGHSQKKIAEQIGCHPSTVSRELARNKRPNGQYRSRGYDPLYAQRKARARRSKRSVVTKLHPDGDLFPQVAEMLDRHWSPQQISGVLRQEQGKPVISHQTVYTYLWSLDKKHPHRKAMRRRGRRPRKAKPGFINRIARERVSIHDRPKCVERRSRIGDWEIDLMTCHKVSGFLITAVDRKSGVVLIRKVASKHNHRVIDGILKMFEGFDRRVLKTFTFDNGVEFYHTGRLKSELGVKVYHADPYRSGQRGTNENTNGLIRQFIPKSLHYQDVTHQWVKKVQKSLNDRPRLRHKYQTPAQFFESHSKIAFRI